MSVLAATSTNGAIFGGLGAGGLALALTVLLVLGVKGKGRVSLKDNPAMVVGFLSSTAFHAAGQVWSHPERITAQGLTGLGVGSGGGPFGNVGIGAVALIILIVMLCAPLSPAFGAGLGLIAGFVWPAAGAASIWAVPSELGAAGLMMIGS